jgi:hypothetical protein
MKSSWMYLGFYHHSVPSLSGTVMRSSDSTNVGLFAVDVCKDLLDVSDLGEHSLPIIAALGILEHVDVTIGVARHDRPASSGAMDVQRFARAVVGGLSRFVLWWEQSRPLWSALTLGVV